MKKIPNSLHLFFKTLGEYSYWLSPNSKILDYGCGEGELVYAFRDSGFDCYGFDIHERVGYRTESDRQFFAFAVNPERDTSNMLVDDGRVPFEDSIFDLIVSHTVIEHVHNHLRQHVPTSLYKPSEIRHVDF